MGVGVVYGFSTKADGNMSVKWGKSQEEVEGNKRKWLEKFEIHSQEVVLADLALGVEFVEVGTKQKGLTVKGIDAFITTEANVPLFMVVGDCFPVVLFDQKQQRLALVHLGYHGIVGNLLEKVIKRFVEMGSRAADIEMKIGPGVKKESYLLPPEDVAQRGMSGWSEFLETQSDGKIAVDLFGYLMQQARGLGITHIEASSVDTIADPDYFSHYRSKRITGEQEGRIAAVAVMRCI